MARNLQNHLPIVMDGWLSAVKSTPPLRYDPNRDRFRFLYFNGLNLAIRSTLANGPRPLPVSIVLLIRNLHCQSFSDSQSHEFSTGSSTFVIAQTRQDGWVVGKCAALPQREYYLLLDSSLPDVLAVERTSMYNPHYSSNNIRKSIRRSRDV